MKHVMRWAAMAVGISVCAAGCSASDQASDAGTSSAASSILRIKDKGVTGRGGTVYVLQDGDFDSLDPANNYQPSAQEVGRLIYRTLTFIKDTPGEDPSIQPDLAEGLGTPSDGGRTWTYRLRAGLKYEDGRTITAQDVKYGVMRSFETGVFDIGARWMSDLLENDTGFEGPYATPDKDLTSVETPDDRTLIFHFSGSQSDADWIMSLFYTAPVPRDKDTRADYGNRPVASGPYRIDDYRRDSWLTLVRNENWDAASDRNRPAYPDRFQFGFDADGPEAGERLIKSDGNDAFGVPLGGVLQVSEFARVQEPSISPQFVNGPGSCVDYVTMNTQSLKDPDVRHAIALAIDRQGIAAIYGGEVFGSVADSVIPPELPGYVAPNLGLSPQGDPGRAKTLLAGKSVPALHLAVADSDGAATKKKTALIKTNLEAAGFAVIVDSYSDEEYSTVYNGTRGWDVDPSGRWCFDWPTAGSMVDPVMGPNSDGTRWGSNNPAFYYDPALSGRLQELKSSNDDSATIAKNYVDIANEIQTTAWPLLPTLHENDPEVVGKNVTNVGISPIFSEVDLNTLAVKP